jgi:transposase-like protein
MEKKSRDDRRANQLGIKCPQAQCGSDHYVRNSSFKTKRRGWVRRFICRTCGHKWEEPPKPAGVLADVGFYDSDEALIQSFALLAEGLPLGQVEGLVGRKAETIQARLQRCFRNERVWHEVKHRLICTYRVLPGQVTELSNLLVAMMRGGTKFHARVRRKLAREIRSQRRPLRARRQEERAYKESFKRLPRLRGLSPEEIDLEWQGYVRDMRNTFELPSASLKRLRNKLKRRVERILSCKIVVTDRGSFYRLRNDSRVIRWFETVKQFDATKHARLLRLLSSSERWLLGRINCSPATAAVLGRFEQEQGGPIPNRPVPKLTLDQLAEPRSAAGLIDDLESLAVVLRLPCRSQAAPSQ